MEQYQDALRHVLTKGRVVSDRTGTGALSTFGYQMRFNLKTGFPLVTTKKVHLRSIIHELLWFLKGDTNVKYLRDNKVTIWDEWADENGDLGPVYGKQWRSWTAYSENSSGFIEGREVDQIADVMNSLATNPDSRRHIVCAWNVGELEQMALPPCHCLFQFYAEPLNQKERMDIFEEGWDLQDALVNWEVNDILIKDGLDAYSIPKYRLSCQLYQRSADLFLGVPFNIASYSLLTMMMAKVLNFEVGEFIHTFGSLHLYSNHLEQAHLQLTRRPKELPQMNLKGKQSHIFGFSYEDFELVGYDPHPTISAPIAI